LNSPSPSFDHVGGGGEQSRWNFEAKCLRGFEVYGKDEIGRLLDRKIGWLGTLENWRDIING
jgi:hypothetical protein